MLRNCRVPQGAYASPFLNEVLSLNAQEFSMRYRRAAHCPLLNEVLSLNAQEYVMRSTLLPWRPSPQ